MTKFWRNSSISEPGESLSDTEEMRSEPEKEERMTAGEEEECVHLPKALLLTFGLHQIKEGTTVKPAQGANNPGEAVKFGFGRDGLSWRSITGKYPRLRRYKSEYVEAEEDGSSLSFPTQTKKSSNRLKNIVQVIMLERKMKKVLQDERSDLRKMKHLVNTFENISSKFVRSKCRDLYYDLLLSIKALELKSHQENLRNKLLSREPDEVHNALQNILEGRSSVDLAQYLYASSTLIDQRTNLRVA